MRTALVSLIADNEEVDPRVRGNDRSFNVRTGLEQFCE